MGFNRHFQHRIAYRILTFVALLPFILLVLSGVIIGLESLVIITWFPMCLLTLMSGLGLSSTHHPYHVVGWVCALLLFLMQAIMGYYDYIQWTSTTIGIITLIFFSIIYVINRTINKSKSVHCTQAKL